MKLWYAIVLLCFFGCASKAERLSREYESISQHIEALQDEQKAITNLQVSATNYLQAKQEYETKKNALIKVQARNAEQGLPTGYVPNWDLGIEKTVPELEKGHGALSDQIRALEKQRSEIAKQQADVE